VTRSSVIFRPNRSAALKSTSEAQMEEPRASFDVAETIGQHNIGEYPVTHYDQLLGSNWGA
jgi:hypothetical protein